MGKTSQEHNLAGLESQRAGDLIGAKDQFLASLNQNPSDGVALYSLASIETQFGNYAEALQYATKAIEVQPQFAPSHLAATIILSKLGRLEEALLHCKLALERDPNLTGAAQLRDSIQKLLNPSDLAPKTNPRVEELNRLALTYQSSGHPQVAKQRFFEVLSLDPQNFVALYSLGVIASQCDQLEEALSFLLRACESSPTNPTAHFAFATTLQQAGLHEKALLHFDKAIELDPGYIQAYTNKSSLLHALNRQKDALLALEGGLSVQPQEPKLLGNKGYILTEFKENAWAAQVFEQLLKVDPKYPFAEGLHAFARMHVCDWSQFSESKSKIIQGISEGEAVCNPLSLKAIIDSASVQLEATKIFVKNRYSTDFKPMWNGEPYRHRYPRVAFLSADFREHPVGYLLIGMIEELRKRKIETIGVSFGISDGSELYRRYRNAFTHYLECNSKPAIEVARFIRGLETDIAIDLSGYTSGSKIEVLAHRPAPRQATYLGYPGTVALPYIDTLIADHVVTPTDLRDCYGEPHILRLGHCYLPRDTSIIPNNVTLNRAEHGLPTNGVVLCSFSHSYKINPDTFDAWVQLLLAFPDSVLWLARMHQDVEKNLRSEAYRRGVNTERLVFASRLPKIEDHLARYSLADIYLDTFPYNGHTTASDALFAGVPIVTKCGQGFASRVGASLLSDLGLKDWIASDWSQYVEIAEAILQSPLAARRRLSEAKEAKSWPPSPCAQADEFMKIIQQMVTE